MEIKIIVHPNSKKPRVEKDLLGDLHIYVKEPPFDGRANEAVIEDLAEYFKVKKYEVSLVKGMKSEQKMFSIEK